MAPRETENNAFTKLGVKNKEHYGMLWYFLERSIVSFQKEESDFCLFILCLVILLIYETHSEKVTIGSSFCMNFFSLPSSLHEFFFLAFSLA